MGTVLQALVIYLLPAVGAFYWFQGSHAPTRLDLFARAVFGIAAMAALVILAPLAKYGVIAPYVWGAGIVGGAVTSATRADRLPKFGDSGEVMGSALRIVTAVAMVFASFVFESRARAPSTRPMMLTLPVRSGTYLVTEGGHGVLFPAAMHNPAQRFAVEFVKLDGFGFSKSSLWPVDPDAFEIWSDLVTAPCDGKVLAAEDERADMPTTVDSSALLGNFVALGCPDATVVFASLQHGSLKVGTASTVRVGEPLARVGASAPGGEAKLRVYAVRGQESSPDRLMGQGEGVPLEFGSGALVRGDRVHP